MADPKFGDDAVDLSEFVAAKDSDVRDLAAAPSVPAEVIPSATPGVSVWRFEDVDEDGVTVEFFSVTHEASGLRLAGSDESRWPPRMELAFDDRDEAMRVAAAMGGLADWTLPAAELRAAGGEGLKAAIGFAARCALWPEWSKELDDELGSYGLIRSVDIVMCGVMEDSTHAPQWGSGEHGSFALGCHQALHGRDLFRLLSMFEDILGGRPADEWHQRDQAHRIDGYRFGVEVLDRVLGRADGDYPRYTNEPHPWENLG